MSKKLSITSKLKTESCSKNHKKRWRKCFESHIGNMFEYAKRRYQFKFYSKEKIKKTPRRYAKINRKKHSHDSS